MWLEWRCDIVPIGCQLLDSFTGFVIRYEYVARLRRISTTCS